jgi:peroxiredoxin
MRPYTLDSVFSVSGAADVSDHGPDDDRPAVDRSAVAARAEVAHLIGAKLPDIRLPATTAPQSFSMHDVGGAAGRLIVYAYPAIGAPDRQPITPDWMSIPGAFGCTAESCGFRDLNAAIGDLDAAVCGLSTQPTAEQREAAQRLSLNFPLLSDEDYKLTDLLDLPTWYAGGRRLLKRFTIVARRGVIEHVFAPVPDPAAHANDVAEWLRNA